MPKNDQIWPKIGVCVHFGPGHAGSFGALLMGWLVVVAQGLFLPRHLFAKLLTIVDLVFCIFIFNDRKMRKEYTMDAFIILAFDV